MRLFITKSLFFFIFLLLPFAFFAQKAEANAPNINGYVKTAGTEAGINGVWVKWTDKNGNVRYTQSRNDSYRGDGWYQFVSWQIVNRENEYNTFVDTDGNGSAESRRTSTTDYSAFGCFENPHTFTVVPRVNDAGTYTTVVMSDDNGNPVNNDPEVPDQGPTTIYYAPPVTIQGRITNSANGAALSGISVTVTDNHNQSRVVSTNSSGDFNVDNFIPKGGVYAVRPGAPIAGYQSPPKTTKTSWSYRICANADTPANQVSYECQEAGNNDCASGTGGYCNFVYNPIPPTPTPIPSGPISSLTATCTNPGNKVTLSWTASDYQKYAVRVDDDVNEVSGPSATVDPDTPNDCPGNPSHDICLNNWTGTSITLNINPTRTYRWWISGIVNDETWTDPVYGTSFRCAPDCSSIAGPYTIVQGQKGTFSALFESKMGNTSGDIVYGQLDSNLVGGPMSSLADWSDDYPEKSPNFPTNKNFAASFTWDTAGVSTGNYQVFCRGFNDFISECRGNSSFFSGVNSNPAAYQCSASNATIPVSIVAPTPTPTPAPKCNIQIKHVLMPDKTAFIPQSGASIDYNALQSPAVSQFNFSGIPSGGHTISLGAAPANGYTVSFSSCVNSTDPNATGCHANVSGTNNYTLTSDCPASGYQDFWFHWYPPTTSVTGQVFYDMDKNGFYESSIDSIYSNASIQLNGVETDTGSTVSLPATTNSTGNYTISGVKRGSYTVGPASGVFSGFEYTTPSYSNLSITDTTSRTANFGAYKGPVLVSQTKVPDQTRSAVVGTTPSLSGLRSAGEDPSGKIGSNYNNALSITQTVNSQVTGNNNNIALSGIAFVNPTCNPTTLSDLVSCASSGGGFIAVYAHCLNATSCSESTTGQSFTRGTYRVYQSGYGWDSLNREPNIPYGGTSRGLTLRMVNGANVSPQFSVTFYNPIGDRTWGRWGYLLESGGRQTFTRY